MHDLLMHSGPLYNFNVSLRDAGREGMHHKAKSSSQVSSLIIKLLKLTTRRHPKPRAHNVQEGITQNPRT